MTIGVEGVVLKTGRKVLLVMDNYTDLSQAEALLKRVGLDTMGLQKAARLADTLLSFAPDAVVLQNYGTQINGEDIASRLKRRRGLPKVLLLNPSGFDLHSVHADAGYEMPLIGERFLPVLAPLLGVPVEIMMEKLLRSRGVNPKEESPAHQGARIHRPVWNEARRRIAPRDYSAMGSDLPRPLSTGLKRQVVRDQALLDSVTDSSSAADSVPSDSDERELFLQTMLRAYRS